jgi:hypothetical protein
MNLTRGNWTASLPNLSIGARSGQLFVFAPGMSADEVQSAVLRNVRQSRNRAKQSARWLQEWTRAGRPMPTEGDVT